LRPSTAFALREPSVRFGSLSRFYSFDAAARQPPGSGKADGKPPIASRLYRRSIGHVALRIGSTLVLSITIPAAIDSAVADGVTRVMSQNSRTIIAPGASKSARARQQGRGLERDPQVLAYAPVAQMEGLRSAIHGAPRHSAANAAKIEARSRAKIAKLAKEEVLSPALTGLRQAARMETAELSYGPAVVGRRRADRDQRVLALKTGQ
jgi:hypothetical protein